MKFYWFIFFQLIFISINAQIKTESQQSSEYYVKNVLLGQGIEVGKVSYVAKNGAMGKFDAPKSILGVTSGLIFSTGNIHKINGPNSADNFTSKSSITSNKQIMQEIRNGDKDLHKIVKEKILDVSKIEFEFVPIYNKLEFNYVFASEEYPEFVGSKYNDVFGFFLSGPGIESKVNVAILPDGFTPVSINTINHLTNKRYFRDNFLEGFDKIKYGANKVMYKEGAMGKQKKKEFTSLLMNKLQFDGLTRVLKVECDVIPYQKYKIKIAIADAGDNVYDSAVLLEAGSFSSVEDVNGKYYSELKKIAHLKHDVNLILSKTVSSKPQVNVPFESRNVWFDFDSNRINEKSKMHLDKLVKYLKLKSTLNCHLKGFTDNMGSLEYNQKLSLKRAKAVRDYLVEQGIAKERLRYYGLYFLEPVAENSTSQGRSENRRVEIVIE